jgi:hypothetical protein
VLKVGGVGGDAVCLNGAGNGTFAVYIYDWYRINLCLRATSGESSSQLVWWIVLGAEESLVDAGVFVSKLVCCGLAVRCKAVDEAPGGPD